MTRITRRAFWTHLKAMELNRGEGAFCQGLCFSVHSAACRMNLSIPATVHLRMRESRRLLAIKPARAPLSGFWWPLTPAGYAARRRVVNRLIRENIRPVRRRR